VDKDFLEFLKSKQYCEFYVFIAQAAGHSETARSNTITTNFLPMLTKSILQCEKKTRVFTVMGNKKGLRLPFTVKNVW
jgi:hypothetical protein